MSIKIRQARFDERGFLSDLTMRSKAHWGYDQAFLASVRQELEFQAAKFAPGFHVYVLEENGERLGFCSLIPVDADSIELHDLFVEPRRISRGYGKQLWNYAVALARDLGYRKLILTADPNAEPFYARQGAIRTGERASAAFPERKLPLMEYAVAGAAR